MIFRDRLQFLKFYAFPMQSLHLLDENLRRALYLKQVNPKGGEENICLTNNTNIMTRS